MLEAISESSLMMYSVLYLFVALFVFVSAKKTLTTLSIWGELYNQTERYFKNYDRRNNPPLTSRVLMFERIGLYKFACYSGFFTAAIIAILSAFQFVSAGFVHNGVDIFSGYHTIIILALATCAFINESIRTGAHCDITIIQHDLSFVLNNLTQK